MHMSANCHMFAYSCAACAVCPRNGLLVMSQCDRQHTMHSIAICTDEQIKLPERSEHAVFCSFLRTWGSTAPKHETRATKVLMQFMMRSC